MCRVFVPLKKGGKYYFLAWSGMKYLKRNVSLEREKVAKKWDEEFSHWLVILEFVVYQLFVK